MALTGTGTRVNTDSAADEFGASIRFPRGLASDGTTCVLFDANKGHALNVETGIATRIGSVSNFLINEGQLRGATYLEDTDQVIFWGNSNNRFYAYNRQNGIASEIGLQFASAWDFWGIASLNGVLYAIDRGEDALYIIDLDAGTATRRGTATEFGIGTGNVQSLCVYDGSLHAFSSTLNRMIRIDETDGTASIVQDMALPDGSPEAAVEHGGRLYYAGSSDDALFRMYDVLWDETIADLEVDEASDETWDLSAISQDAASFSLQGSPPSWLSISGTDLVATSAPAVTRDTDYQFTVRATRDGVNVDETLTVTVANTDIALTAPSAPLNLTATPQSNGTDVLLDWDTPSSNGGAAISDYEVSSDDGSSWTAIGSTDTNYTVTRLDKNTEYDFKVRAVNSEGSGTATATVTATTAITTSSAPQSLTVTVPTNGTSLSLSWDAPSDDGGELTDYEYSTDDGSSWTSTGSTTTSYTVTGLDKNTEYDVKVRAVNSAGNGTASATATATTATTVPNAPTGLTVTVGQTTTDLSWTAPSDNGGDTISSYEVSSDDGATWTDTGDADLTYQITGLTAATEYDFKVRAVNSEGSGTASSTVTETTNAATPIVQTSGLTGTGISLGNGRFGDIESYARGATSDGPQAYNFGRTQGYTLNIATGESVASGATLPVSGTVRGAMYHNNQVVVYVDSRDLHVWIPGTGFASTALVSNLRYSASSGISGTPTINSIESHNGVVYATDDVRDRLFVVDMSDGQMTPIGSYSNRNIGGLVSHGGQLLATDNTNDRLVIFNTTTGVPTNVANNNALPGARTIDFLLSQGDELYGGQFADGLLRFYNIRWDDDIEFEVDEGEEANIDLNNVSDDADTFSFSTGYTPPSWLEIVGDMLHVQAAPFVDTDTDYEVELTATRDGVTEDTTVTVRSIDTGTLPTWHDNIPAFAVDEGADRNINLAAYLTDATSLAFAPGYTAPSWLSISALRLVVTSAPLVNTDTDFNVQLRASNADGSADETIVVSVQNVAPADPPVFSPVPRREVDERDSTTFDLSSHLTNADTLAFSSAYTPPSWLTLSGESLVVTNAPTVTANSDNTVELTATNEHGDTDRNVTVRIRNIQDPPVWASVPRQDVNENANRTIDLSTYLTDADSISFRSGYTPPSWLSVTGLNLIATNAPSVSIDTDNIVQLTATNEDGSTNRNITVRIINVAAPPIWDATIARQDVNEGTTATIDVRGFVSGEDSIAFAPGYTPEGWLTISGGILSIDGTQAVSQNTDYSIQLRATNSEGIADKTIDIRIIVVPVPVWDTIIPLISVDEGEDHTQALAPYVHNETDIDFSSGYSVPSWLSISGTDLIITTAPDVDADTDYDVDLTASNAGGGADRTITVRVNAAALVATTLVEVSGDSQNGTVGTALDDPFVVEVRDQDGDALAGVTVTFAVTGGDGTLSDTSVTTGANGRAQSTLALGSTAGTNTVTASVSGITGAITFTATGTAVVVNLPGQVRGVGVTALSRSLRFVWDVPDAGDASIQRYEYQVDGGAWISTGSDMPEFVIDGLDNGTEYSVRIRARSALGAGQASEAVTATPAWPTPREGCYLLDLVDSDFTGYTAPQLTTTDTTLDADLGESVNVGLIRIQTDAETDITSVIVQGSPDGDTQYVHLGEIEIGAGEYHALRLSDRSVQALRLIVKTVSTPANLHTIEVYAVRVDLSSNVAGFSAEELQLGQNSYRRYDGVLVTSDGLRTVPRVELSLAQLTTKQTAGLTALMGEADFYLLAGLVDRYRVSIATDALRFTGRRGAHSLSLSLTGAVDLNNFTLTIEMEGQDISHLWIPEDGITVRRSIDTPQLNTVTTDTLTFSLDNEDFDFELNQPDNFFLREGLTRHGRGAQVLIEINDTPVFAGFVWRVQSDLQSSRVRVQVVDMFAYMAQAEIQDLGEPLDLEITSFPGALDLYTTEDPVFPFPLFALPIVTGSVSATMSENGATVDVDIVEVVNTEGDLSPRRAEVDHTRGLLRFEAPPLDGQPTTITAEWKIALQYKRIDTLIRRVLENTGIIDRIGITPTSVQSFSIEQIPILLSENRFSSHGRPYPSGLGIVRHIMRDAANKKRYMTHDDKLIEYDEGQDEYTELATFPSSSTGVTPPAFGTLLTSESFQLPTGYSSPGAIAVSDSLIYLQVGGPGGSTPGVYEFTHQGAEVDGVRHVFANRSGLEYYNGLLYRLSGGGGVTSYDAEYNVDTFYSLSGFGGTVGRALEIYDDSIWVIRNNQVVKYDFDEVEQLTFNPGAGLQPQALAIGEDTIWVARDSSDQSTMFAFDLDGTANTGRNLPINLANNAIIEGANYHNGRVYLLYRLGNAIPQVGVYYVGGEALARNYVPWRFDSHDFEDFYAISTETDRGDQVLDRSFSPVRVYKYDKSADDFTLVLDEDDGEPQLAHPYTDAGSEVFRADNRKNFQVVRRSSKTLIFYRRVESAQSSIAVKNETDDVITNIHTTAHSVGDGLPYSMDFGLDIRSDGIYVYSFVVYYSATNSTLRLYRERFQPAGTQSQRYTETIARVDDDDSNAQYAVSVSDVILNDDDDKWYFVLTWGAEGTGIGKAELCTIAKDGGGSRTVLKTYDDPLLSARSPAEMNGRFFYVEGGWVRREKTSTDDDVPAEEHHYPNEGGTLIEIESDDSITDHGIIWRSANKTDSPDSDPDIDTYDGYGLHNAIVSNLNADDSDNLHVVAGYGEPYDIEDNSPFARVVDPIVDRSNFNWIQWGENHAGKIGSFPVSGQRGLPLIQALAALGFANIGVPPTTTTDARLVGETVSAWQRYASIYFRSRHDAQITLRTAVGSGAVSQLDVDAVGLPDAGEVLFGTEIFAYTGTVEQSGVISRLQGVTRAQHGSTASAQSAGITGVRVDGFIDAGDDSEIYTVRDRALDFINQKNRVTVGLAAGTVEATDSDSIDDFGEFALSLGASPTLFSRFDADWAELLADLYLDSLKEPKEVLAIATRLDLSVEVGQVVVVDIDYRIKIGYKAFVVTQVAHALPQSVTDIQLREV